MEGTILGSKLSLLRMKWEFRLLLLSTNSSVPQSALKAVSGALDNDPRFLPRWQQEASPETEESLLQGRES